MLGSSICCAKPSAMAARRIARKRSKVGLINMAALLSVSEITSTADIAVKQRRRHRGIGFGPVVEPGLEYRGDALIEAGVKAQGASASRLQPLGAILFGQAHQAEANPQGLLAMQLALADAIHEA